MEYDQREFPGEALSSIGEFGGLFGGTGATEVAGAVSLSEFDGVGDPLGLSTKLETGIFVLDR